MTARVFELCRSAHDWHVGLTSEAANLVRVSWCHAHIDQNRRFAGMGMRRVNTGAPVLTGPPDLAKMLAEFLQEAINYARESGLLPRQRIARRSPAKRAACDAIALIANERLAGAGVFRPGVNTYGLNLVFAPLLGRE